MCLRDLFYTAFRVFLEREAANIRRRVAERTLCGRLAMYLEDGAGKAGLQGYFADVDYNRNHGHRVKTILDDNMREIVIVADLLLHSRGQILKRDNLIAVEMKKSIRPLKERQSDRHRLKLMTRASYDGVYSLESGGLPKHVCGYEFGVYIELDTRRSHFLCEEYQGGELVRSLDGIF